MIFEEIISNVLMEGLDVSTIKEKYYPDIPEEDFERIVSADPTSGNGERLGNYSKWLLSLYRHLPENERRRLVDEDLTKATSYLTTFDKYKNKLPQESRDINRYPSLPSLYGAISQFIGNKPHTKGEVTRQIKEGAEKVYEDERWLVVVPHTKEAACLYGAHTQWCTAAREDNMFDEYNQDGNLYINIDKQNNRKYQFHFESEQFMDETDENIPRPVLDNIGATPGLRSFYQKNLLTSDFLKLLYDYIGDFSEGLAAVKMNGKWSFIDKNGREVIPPKYDWVEDFSEGFARVKLNGKWGFIDKNGREVIPSKYDWVRDFSEGFARVQLNGKWGFVDERGREVIPCKYDEAREFSEGLAAVRINGKWGFIDKSGREVIPCKYDFVWDFSEGLAWVKMNGKKGLIDKSGREVIPPKYDSVGDFIEGFAVVQLNDKWGFIDKAENWYDKKPTNLQENMIKITRTDLRNMVLECARQFLVSEEHMPVPKKTNVPFSISPEKVLKVKRFLDNGFQKGNYEDVGPDGMPCSYKVVAMLSSDKQTPLKNMYMEDLYDLLCAKFKTMFNDEQERALFMRRVADDWYDGKINSLGMLSVNHL